jgi:hypothetical protein
MDDLTDTELRELEDHLTAMEDDALARYDLAGAHEWDGAVLNPG